MAVAAGIATGLVLLVALGWAIFGSKENFFEAVRFYLTPNIISLFRGEMHEDWWAEMKIFLWLAGSAGCGAAVWWWLR